MKIADLYIRVNNCLQAGNDHSLRNNQHEALVRYCERNNIVVGRTVFEVHSAKTFNRPAWAELLTELREEKNKSNLLLFTTWDRFSRNAHQAYQMIETIKSLGVETRAIKQPVDLDLLKNKIGLTIYI